MMTKRPLKISLIGLVAWMFVLVWAASLLAGCQRTYYYPVKVQEIGTGKVISNADVIIEVNGKKFFAPTDEDGLARVPMDSSYSGQPAVLTVEAGGYSRKVKNATLSNGSLPDVVQLKPKTNSATNTPEPLPTDALILQPTQSPSPSVPSPTFTRIPPSATPMPTATPVPPTNTNTPTATGILLTKTPAPGEIPPTKTPTLTSDPLTCENPGDEFTGCGGNPPFIDCRIDYVGFCTDEGLWVCLFDQKCVTNKGLPTPPPSTPPDSSTQSPPTSPPRPTSSLSSVIIAAP